MLPRGRAVMLTNYPEVARSVGLEPHGMIARAQINADDLSDPENWLGASCILSLIDDSAEQSGRDDFGILLGKCRTFTSLGPVALLLKHEASVRSMILAAIEFRYLLNDLLHLTVRDDGEWALVEWNLIPGLESRHAANLMAATAYRGISEALGFHWEPDRIHFRHTTPKNVVTFERFFRCPLEFNSQFDGMSCASETLSQANPFADADLTTYARRLLSMLPAARDDSVTEKVRSIVLLLIDDGEANAERVAQCLGVQVRTLQRGLMAEGTSFSTVLNETRRSLATRYVEHSSQNMTAISQLTGFSGSPAFTTWFTNEFGMPPTRWRRLKDEEAKDRLRIDPHA